MKRFLSRYVVCVATACIGLLATTTAFAQKAGTAITFDTSNATELYTSVASNKDISAQPFGYFRHNVAPIQIVSSNDGVVQAGTGLYSESANNMNLVNEKITIASSNTNHSCPLK